MILRKEAVEREFFSPSILNENSVLTISVVLSRKMNVRHPLAGNHFAFHLINPRILRLSQARRSVRPADGILSGGRCSGGRTSFKMFLYKRESSCNTLPLLRLLVCK
jgi:hypothetical protein